MDILNSFAVRLKKLRKERKLTQEQLADNLNLARTTVAGYEKENKEPSYETLVQISKLFNVTTDYLLGASVNRTYGNGDIGDKLGLDDNAIEVIKNAKESNIMNEMLRSDNFNKLVHIFEIINDKDTKTDTE